MNGYTVRMHEEIEEKAESLASMAGPELIAMVENAVDQWYDEHTTLSGEEGQLYKGRLKRAALRKVGQAFLARAAEETV